MTAPHTQRPALLVLEDGKMFAGTAFGAAGTVTGEAVFCTAMTGYQETLTDPSYAGQILTFTAPQIGNTGVNDADAEAGRVWPSGVAVRQLSRRTSSWRAERDLDSELAAAGVVGIAGIDTRALTRHLRERGAMRAALSSEIGSTGELHERALASPSMVGADLAPLVSTPQPYVVPADGPVRYRVAALDLGMKRATPAQLARRGVETHVFPARSTADQLLAVEPHGIFVSNGPGDPAAADYAVHTVADLLDVEIPLFGICFGHQLLARALGFSTYKLRYGHRGVNQPVRDTATGRVMVTAHNHGFAVAAPDYRVSDSAFGRVEVSHLACNDGVVEGLRCLDVPAFSVQFHPEAAAGPHDAQPLFDEFVARLEQATGKAVPEHA